MMLKKERQKKKTLQGLATIVNDLTTNVSNITIMVTDLATTVDDLAIITAKNFAEMHEEFRGVRTDMHELNTKVSNIETELHEFREEFNDRTGTLENIVYVEHRGRLEKLEKSSTV